jgi:hypothetical protein
MKKLKFWDAPFVLCLNKQVLDAPYILQVASPHYVGKLLFFDSALQYAEWLGQAGDQHLAYTTIPGYRIAVVFAGALSGHQLYAALGWERELETLIQGMARFYKEHTIDTNEAFYRKKYLL